MARFYQTAQRNFVDDFIFQPNMELAAMALQKKDGDIKDQLDTLELMRNLPIDYWKEADQNNVNQIQQEYESRVDEITKQMQGDLMNTGNNRYLINQLRKDVEKDYSSGRIRQIQDNAQAYKQYKTKLEGLTNPADREGYGRATSQYIQTTPGGALTSVFKAPELYQTEQYGNDFVKSENFKRLEAESGGTITQSPKGEWLVKIGNTFKKLEPGTIETAFQGFIKSNPNVMGRAIAGGKFFGENNWLDENGELSFKPGSYLGDQMIPIAKSLAYKNTTSETSYDTNAPAMARLNSDLSFNNYVRQKRYDLSVAPKETMLSAPAKNVSFFTNFTKEGQKMKTDYIQIKNAFLEKYMTEGQKQMKANPRVFQTILDNTEAKIRKRTDNSAKQLDGIEQNYEKLSTASFGSYKKPGITQEKMDAIVKNYTSPIFEDRMRNTPVYVDFGNIGGQQYANKGGRPVKLQELRGKKYTAPGPYNGWEIIDEEPIKGSGMPLDLTSVNFKDNAVIGGATMGFDIVLRKPGKKGEDEVIERVPVEVYSPSYVFEVN